MNATDTIRIRIEPGLKQKLQKRCDVEGITLSQLIRDFLIKEASLPLTTADRFDAIMENARIKTAATGLAEPSIDDINSYISSIRQQRQEAMTLGKSA